MNLTELQIELRSIADRIAQFHSEIENMKPQTDEQKKTNFKTISKLAKQHPIRNQSIEKAPEWLRKAFINSLSYLLLTEQKDIYSGMLYLCRLAEGCGLNMSGEEIYQSGMGFKSEDIEAACVELKEYKYYYLIEAFIIANLSAEAPLNMLTIIADMAKLMGCDEEEIRVLAQISKSKLIDNLEIIKDIPLPSKNNLFSGKFEDYIPKEWIVSQRKECALICTEKNIYDGSSRRACVVKSRSQTGSIVRKGETLLVYEERRLGLMGSAFFQMDKEVGETIVAPNDGIVVFMEKEKKDKNSEEKDKYLAVYVISFFDDIDDFGTWYEKKKLKLGGR